MAAEIGRGGAGGWEQVRGGESLARPAGIRGEAHFDEPAQVAAVFGAAGVAAEGKSGHFNGCVRAEGDA